MEQHAPVRGFMLLLAMFGYLLLGLVALGALMERAMSGQRWELLRLALTVGAAALLCATESSPVWVIILPIVYVLVSLALALALALMQRMAVVVARS